MEAKRQLEKEFAKDVRDSFSPLQSEIAARNKLVQENDQFIYGDLIQKSLDIPLGHDYTAVNWLRRTVEIHRAQFLGKGFAVDSTYLAEDLNDAPKGQDGQPDPAAKDRLKIENDKRKDFAEARRNLLEAILRDNGGDSLWAQAAETASAVGDAVIKGWYDEDAGKYHLQLIEIVDYFYALWNRDDYRTHDAVAYIYQLSPERAHSRYDLPEDTPTSQMGTPLAVLSSTSTTNYVTTQPMITVMEVTGKLIGWTSDGKGNLQKCKVGKETELNAVLVGDTVIQLIDDPKQIPHYYILPNKRARRRPWGIPDISKAAIDLNLTYVEALSDWRTLANKVNFPKWKAFGFPAGVQLPKPKPRTAEILPMAEGQDLQPLGMGQGPQMGESDFQRQLEELKSEFVREVGVSRQLFDLPDGISNSNQAQLTAMKSISDLTTTKRSLWEPILRQIFTDALHTLAHYDSNIKEVVEEDDSEWHIKVSWPSALNTDDPSYQAMQLNRFHAGTMSLQSFLESMGNDKQEIDRIREEMEDALTAAIHGNQLGELAHFKIFSSLGIPPWGFNQPKISIKGDLTPQQEGNLAQNLGWNDGPYGASIGPQGLAGDRANENEINQGFVQGGSQPYAKYGHPAGLPFGQPINPQQGNPAQGAPMASQSPQLPQAPGQGGAPQPQQPQQINTGANVGGANIMSQPGSGATATSAHGKVKQHQQRKGA